jgi:hypothetical protein
MTDDLVQRLRTELLEWLDKTKWVRQTCQTHELGLHRADILRNRIEALTAEVELLRKALGLIALGSIIELDGEDVPIQVWLDDEDMRSIARAALDKQP